MRNLHNIVKFDASIMKQLIFFVFSELSVVPYNR